MSQIFVSCPPGLEDLLSAELQPWCGGKLRATAGGVFCEGDLGVAYRMCYRSRLASRVFWRLDSFDSATDDELYRALRSFPWEEHLTLDHTFAFRVTVRKSFTKNTAFVAQRAKDALADRFTEKFGRRPDVERHHPDMQFHLHLQQGKGTLYLDLAGAPLHERGYRQGAGEAPLKESLAAAVLYRLGWPKSAAYIVDPMCGSGTFLIEAVGMALNLPAGLHRSFWGFEHWKQHDASIWQAEVNAAKEAIVKLPETKLAVGRDVDEKVLKQAQKNVEAAELNGWIVLEKGSFKDWLPKGDKHGALVVANPPYGERLGDRTTALSLYAQLGDWMMEAFPGAKAAVLVPDDLAGKALGYHTDRRYHFRNGPLHVALWCFSVTEEKRRSNPFSNRKQDLDGAPQDLVNRLNKNRKRLEKWRKQHAIEAYRIYDADLPEFACAIDRYGDCFHVQEYAPPAELPESKTKRRLDQVLLAIRQTFDVDPSRIFVKQRRRLRRNEQYRKGEELFGRQDGRMEIREHGLSFEVDLASYLDTGLFLDHRPVRRWVRELAKGKRVLNLFCYTGSVSVYAAAGGAASVVSVDMSKTYLQWAKRNMAQNGLDGWQHAWLRADVLQWVHDNSAERYDLIFCDPPSFSNSKSMQGTWDVQRDHGSLLRLLMQQLEPEGVLIFSTNLRRFRMDDGLLEDFSVENVTHRSIDPDFARRPNIHHVFFLRHRLTQ